MTRMHLLKATSLVPRMIKLFYKEIKINFLHLFVFLHVDNAMEYIEAGIFRFCANNGIIY